MAEIQLDDFDFGFSLVDQTELEVVKKAQTELQSTTTAVTATQTKLERLYNSIQPLLNNLKKNPEKEYILWPDRVKKIEKFQDHLDSIYFDEEQKLY